MKIRILCLTFLFGCLSSKAQFQALQLTSPTPASPNAASLGKFGEIPVSLSSGIPSITIPISEINSGMISMPVSLNYHAGGIKVEERASWVGLGWSLNAGGVVTRACRGLPDEIPEGFKNMGYKVNLYPNGMTTNERKNYIENIEFKIVDPEPDIFYYNFGNYSGKFFFTNNGQIMTMPRNNLKITYIDQPQHGWEIITPDGTKYLFNEKEITTSTPYRNGEEGNPIEMETSWYLKQATDIYGNQLQFQYDEENYNFSTQDQHTMNVYIGSPEISGNCLIAGVSSYSYNAVQGKRLSKILYTNGELVFIPQARTDFGGLALSKIQVKNSATLLKEFVLDLGYFTGASRLKLQAVKEIFGTKEGAKYRFDYTSIFVPDILSFSQDHWGYFNGASNPHLVSYQLPNGTHAGANKEPNSAWTQMGMLEKITYPTGGTTRFEYENNTVPEWEPEHYEDAPIPVVALSGNNANPNGENTIRFQQSFTITPADLNGQLTMPVRAAIFETVPPTSLNWFVYCKILDANNALVANLNNNTQLQLSAGSYILDAELYSEYPGNPSVSFSASLIKQQLVPGHFFNRLWGGLRIKKIENLSAPVGSPEIKTFKYEKFGETITSGTSGLMPSYTYPFTVWKTRDIGTYPHPVFEEINCEYRTYNSGSNYPLLTTGGSYVVYGNVTTEFGEDALGGKTESFFTTHIDYADEYHTAFPFAAPTSYEWRRAWPLKEIKYKKTTTGFEKISEEENVYQLSMQNNPDYITKTSEGIKIGRDQIFQSGIVGNFWTGLKTEKFSMISELYTLKSKTTRIINPAEPNSYLETSISYDYSDTHFQPLHITTYNSKGEEKTLNYKYPHEMQSTPTPNIYNEMVNRHIWTPIIEQSELRDNNFLRSAKINYNFWNTSGWGINNSNSIIVPQTIEAKTLNNAAEVTGEYLSYNAKGDALSLSKPNDVIKTYIRGYNDQYVVASITGKSYTDAIAQSGINLSVVNNPPDDNTLRIELDKLRSLSGALVTTYIYNPQVGITSETDPNGRSVYYEYDELKRLVLVRDQHHYILKKICYNYAGKPEDCASPCLNTAPNWENTTTPLRCQQTGGVCGFTGYQEQEQRDINLCSPSHNETRWITAGYNPTVCPQANVQLTYQTFNISGFTAVYTNALTGAVFTFNIPSSGTGFLGCIPEGTYYINISKPGNNTVYFFNLGCRSVSGTSVYTKITVTPSACNQIYISLQDN